MTMVPGERSAAALQVQTLTSAGDTALAPRGELDLASAPLLASAIARARCEHDGRVVVDLGAVTFVDAAGMRPLLWARGVLGRRLTIRPAPPRVHRVFAIAGVDRDLPFVSNAAARAGARARAAHDNIAFVRRLWSTWYESGLEAFLELVPRGVRWQPAISTGRILQTPELRDFWAGRTFARPERPPAYTALGDDVLARGEALSRTGELRPSWMVYRFDGPRLTSAAAFEDEASALTHA